MAILNTHNLGQSFGAFDLFANVTVGVEPDAKIGLVGPNGIGKTSLLLLLCGLEQPAAGSVTVKDNVRIGYLRQEAMQAFHEATNTVWEEMMSVFSGIQAQEDRLRELEIQMGEARGDDLQDILEEYGTIQEAFEALGGYDYEVRIKSTLEGLGFSEPQHATPLMQLSGGQKTRALLARLLLARPDLLILDEPTNHLDISAVQWLEKTLHQWGGALLIVSHDRYFLDTVVNTIWEMSRKGIETYKGNYSAYVKQRQERREHAEKVHEQEMERLYGDLDYIKKNIARASTNGGAVGRLRRLSRDLAAIEEMGLQNYKQSKRWADTGVGGVRMYTVAEAESALKAIPAPTDRPPRFGLRFKTTIRGGENVLRTRDLEVGYPDRRLFDADDIVFTRTECAALIGGNGTGKTTLLKNLTGEIEPLGGSIVFGSGLKVGYFAQAHDGMDSEKTVLDELMSHKDMLLSEARKHLAQYLFRADDVYKKVGMLSGGERGKLAMAILALNGANLLLLDEPTNHLDIQAQEILQEVLEAFEGTILLVSHDRYLIDRLATQIWSLENGHLSIFKGTYQEFIAVEKPAKVEQPVEAPQKTNRNNERKSSEPKKSEALSKLELQIHSVESSLKEIDQLLQHASAAQKTNAVADLGQQYAQQQTVMESLMAQWAEMAEGQGVSP